MIPKPANKVPVLQNFITRQVLVSYELKENEKLELGRDQLIHGLGIDDHTSFIRSKNRNGVSDIPTQGRFHYWQDDRRLTMSLFAPSFQELNLNREYGG